MEAILRAFLGKKYDIMKVLADNTADNGICLLTIAQVCELAKASKPLKNYVLAEEYRQKYLDKNPGGHCHVDLILADKTLYDESKFKVPSKDELKVKLSDLQYAVTQEKSTEKPYSSEYDKFDKKGIYVDIVSKKPLLAQAINLTQDTVDLVLLSLSLLTHLNIIVILVTIWIEYKIILSLVNSHLGHVFTDLKTIN